AATRRSTSPRSRTRSRCTRRPARWTRRAPRRCSPCSASRRRKWRRRISICRRPTATPSPRRRMPSWASPSSRVAPGDRLAATPAAAVEFAKVSVRFATPAGGAHTVVSDISLSIAAGTFVALVGPSGCGKSTLLNVAAGLLAPPEGKVRVLGEELRRINRHAAYLFQQDALLPWRSVLDNVRLGLDFRRVPAAEAESRARAFIAREI